MARSIGISLFVMLGVPIACEASAIDAWDQFLQEPNADSLAALSREVDPGQCDWGKPANKKVVPDRVRGPLFDLIASGNRGAFQLGLSVVRCLDGGDLEDFHRSSGQFMERNPRRFLAEVTERNVATSDVASMASSVPTNDDPDAALAKVRERIALLRDLTGGKIASAQATSIRALQEREADLQRMKESPK